MGELVTGIVGIAGVLFGLFADRLLQRYGKVRCEMEPIELRVYTEASTVTLRSLPIPASLLSESAFEQAQGFGDAGVQYFLSVKFFNEKETKTGLRDVVTAFEGVGHAVPRQASYPWRMLTS